ncbi:MAG: hypothetical protein KC776_11670 [Myxococcales bacterium]|nr:hypothetical protein [Myxococcales bacterium]MCB9583010.1 hypothetical protein [Polyangiaceae bacterium]
MPKARSVLLSAVMALFTVVMAQPGCSASGGDGGPKLTGGNSGSGGGSGDGGGLGGQSGNGGSAANGSGICLLNNCHSDGECDGCTYGRNKCKLDENRCVACDPTANTGCAPGETCTSFGICAPEEATCPTDAQGEPTVTCSANKDCVACDPMHQICDTTTGKCQACTEQDKSACLGSDKCAEGKCEQKCPLSCTTDSECGACETAGKKLDACNGHQCAECSDTKPCGAGLECEKGNCVKPCGQQGSPTAGGDCTTDAECYGCGNTNSTEKWTCKYPINNGTHGTCTVPAQGCEDVGGVALPAPFNSATNLCSTDGNCAGVTADIDVGKLIKDLVGSDELNLGIKKVKLNDAVLSYPMPKCASINLIDDKKCGLCVPCKTDADCKPIDLDPVVNDLFAGDPLAQIAAAFLMDQLFGKGEKHQLHMQCQPVAAGYGACIPCSNPTKGCGAGSQGSSTTGKCDHDTCTEGGPLLSACSLCSTAICTVDPYCCSSGWDALCVKAATAVCPGGCGTSNDPCPHDACDEGAALSRACSSCSKVVCDQDPFCCNTENGTWDSLCVEKAAGLVECSNQCFTGTCSHSECVTGEALGGQKGVGCSTCSGAVCAQDKSCCETSWGGNCVAIAQKQAVCTCN